MLFPGRSNLNCRCRICVNDIAYIIWAGRGGHPRPAHRSITISKYITPALGQSHCAAGQVPLGQNLQIGAVSHHALQAQSSTAWPTGESGALVQSACAAGHADAFLDGLNDLAHESGTDRGAGRCNRPPRASRRSTPPLCWPATAAARRNPSGPPLPGAAACPAFWHCWVRPLAGFVVAGALQVIGLGRAGFGRHRFTAQVHGGH